MKHRGWLYDLAAGVFDMLLHRGKVRELRQRTLDLARIRPGQQVLDVGCGTGTLAIAAQRLVGETGQVCGVDPDERQVARARAKAARRRTPIEVWIGGIEQLDFPEATFDVVLSTMMLHHLPDDLLERGLAEIARVLKPGGRLVIADFPGRDLPALLWGAGLSLVESAELPFPVVPGSPAHRSGRMEFVAAVRPPSPQAARVLGRLDRMVEHGHVTEAEAERLRAAGQCGELDDAIRDVRLRHAGERLSDAVSEGAVTQAEADAVLERVRQGEHPRFPRALRRRGRP